MRFALNHIATPKLSLADFLGLARRLGMPAIEIRNDLPDVVGTMPAGAVRAAAVASGVDILSINALYPFNVWSGDVPARALALVDYAQACGARALVMCPLNDGTPVPHGDLVAALRELVPILRQHGITGLVESLGFPVSSLRTKREAIEAIREAGASDVCKLVHDTFHHHLAGEREFFPEFTGLVHISGVREADLALNDMLDADRALVDEMDRLNNIGQLRALATGGYAGAVSIEPFARSVHDDPDPEAALRASFAHVAQGVA